MWGLIGRAVGVLTIVAAVALAVAGPWQSADQAGDFQPVPGFGGSDQSHMITYDMPEPTKIPALPDGVARLDWPELFVDGFTLIPDGERIGAPTAADFPPGTNPSDIDLFFQDMGSMRSLQPQVGGLNDTLDGARVTIAGYTTPVGFSEGDTDFLLVPVLGACIHVPPPPPNQIVLVQEPAGEVEMFAPVWVTGVLKVSPTPTILADVGYRLDDAVVTAYR